MLEIETGKVVWDECSRRSPELSETRRRSGSTAQGWRKKVTAPSWVIYKPPELYLFLARLQLLLEHPFNHLERGCEGELSHRPASGGNSMPRPVIEVNESLSNRKC